MKKDKVTGDKAKFISQKRAMRKLQLSLYNFRRLCIIKGIYPQEPKSIKKLGHGSSQPRTYFIHKDIKFLAHEPIIQKFRDIRAHLKKVKRSKERRDKEKLEILQLNNPHYSLLDIVKERYPRKETAIMDMDDNLNLLFLFSRMPRIPLVNNGLIVHSRYRVVEFLNYVVAQRCVRKTFITIRGFYVQVNIEGIPVTFVMPHETTAHVPERMDFRLMSNFLEFAVTMVGCVMARLYKENGLTYPPKVSDHLLEDRNKLLEFCQPNETQFELLASLTHSLILQEDRDDVDESNEQELENIDSEMAPILAEERAIKRLRKLFDKLKIFLNPEVPRQYLCLLLRSCGANVSWSPSCGLGFTFDENDSGIRYQIIDRPIPNNKRVANRNYVVPQWVADCINARRLMPVVDYMPGANIPPHLSPFLTPKNAFVAPYQPPEMDYLKGLVTLEEIKQKDMVVEAPSSSSDESEDEKEKMDIDESPKKSKPLTAGEIGKVEKGLATSAATKANREAVKANKEVKLREMLIPKKKKMLYNKMKHSHRKALSEESKMREKRKENLKNKKKKTK